MIKKCNSSEEVEKGVFTCKFLTSVDYIENLIFWIKI